MTTVLTKPGLSRALLIALWAAVLTSGPIAAQQAAGKATHSSAAQTFDTPDQAADALIAAADKFDVPALIKIFGAGQSDIIVTGDKVQARNRVQAFAAQAHEHKSISVSPTNSSHAVLIVGKEDWPFPVPLVRRSGKWSFDGAAGREELLRRRIGGNELDAIAICRGYVEAQYDYALQKREGYNVNEYAQRIISTPGKRDGLAWQNPDGTWGGPVGENIAAAIEEGYTSKAQPYHGYFFKVLKKQGPAAPNGALDYVVKGLMIGGFALVAAPAEYGRSGIKTFIVSHAGVVYEKDLGAQTLANFKKMERFNPDKSWAVVPE